MLKQFTLLDCRKSDVWGHPWMTGFLGMAGKVMCVAAPNTPEASLERLAPLVDYLAAWKLLPNVSRWVLQTLEKGYRIQFGAPPPPFKRIFLTLVSPKQVLVLEQEVISLLRKEAIEVVPPLDREYGFYSWYFIVPKKDGGLRTILDLRLLNRSVMRLKFRMLTVKQVVSQIRSEDWFVTKDLKDAYFQISILPSHRKFLRFAFRGKAYQYRVFPFGLALSPRTFTKCVDAALAPLRLQGIRILNYIDDWLILAHSEQMAVQHRDVVLAQMKELGLRLNAKKSVLSQQTNKQIKLRWALFVTYTIIQSIMRSELCSLHLTHPSVHTWSSGQPTVQRPGSSRGLPVGARIRTHNLGLPRVSSTTLFPLGQWLPQLGQRLPQTVTITLYSLHYKEPLI